MSKPVIPTLFVDTPTLENRSDKVTYLLKFLLFNPGWISSWYDNYLLSMRKSMAEYTEDKSRLVPALRQFIENAVHKYYSDYNVRIDTIDDENDPTAYSMDIFITDNLGNLVIQLDRIRKDNSGCFVFKGV